MSKCPKCKKKNLEKTITKQFPNTINFIPTFILVPTTIHFHRSLPASMVANMKPFILIMLKIWGTIIMGYCVGTKRKPQEHFEICHRTTRQPIAVNSLRKLYEKEHFQFHKEEANERNVLEWEILEQKDLEEYCYLYLHHIIPNIPIDGATGTNLDVMKLRYENDIIEYFPIKENNIIVIRCEKQYFPNQYYYITRAPEPNCTYALLRDKGYHIFVIINKHCGFELPHSRSKIITHGVRKEICEKVHKWTGQPIGKEKYIHEYEQEHQELFKKEANSEYLSWPYIMGKENLDEYCSQYLHKCNPRKTGNVKGLLTREELEYWNTPHGEKGIYFSILAIKCMVTRKSVRTFYITRAATNNCVFALIRGGSKGGARRGPLGIIFKHCDFEDLEQSQGSDVPPSSVLPDWNILPKYEIKEEISGTLNISIAASDYEVKKKRLNSPKPLQLFPIN